MPGPLCAYNPDSKLHFSVCPYILTKQGPCQCSRTHACTNTILMREQEEINGSKCKCCYYSDHEHPNEVKLQLSFKSKDGTYMKTEPDEYHPEIATEHFPDREMRVAGGNKKVRLLSRDQAAALVRGEKKYTNYKQDQSAELVEIRNEVVEKAINKNWKGGRNNAQLKTILEQGDLIKNHITSKQSAVTICVGSAEGAYQFPVTGGKDFSGGKAGRSIGLSYFGPQLKRKEAFGSMTDGVHQKHVLLPGGRALKIDEIADARYNYSHQESMGKLIEVRVHVMHTGTREQCLIVENVLTDEIFGADNPYTLHGGCHNGGISSNAKGTDSRVVITEWIGLIEKIRNKEFAFSTKHKNYAEKVLRGFDWLEENDDHWVDPVGKHALA